MSVDFEELETHSHQNLHKRNFKEDVLVSVKIFHYSKHFHHDERIDSEEIECTVERRKNSKHMLEEFALDASSVCSAEKYHTPLDLPEAQRLQPESKKIRWRKTKPIIRKLNLKSHCLSEHSLNCPHDTKSDQTTSAIETGTHPQLKHSNNFHFSETLIDSPSMLGILEKRKIKNSRSFREQMTKLKSKIRKIKHFWTAENSSFQYAFKSFMPCPNSGNVFLLKDLARKETQLKDLRSIDDSLFFHDDKEDSFES